MCGRRQFSMASCCVVTHCYRYTLIWVSCVQMSPGAFSLSQKSYRQGPDSATLWRSAQMVPPDGCRQPSPQQTHPVTPSRMRASYRSRRTKWKWVFTTTRGRGLLGLSPPSTLQKKVGQWKQEKWMTWQLRLLKMSLFWLIEWGAGLDMLQNAPGCVDLKKHHFKLREVCLMVKVQQDKWCRGIW